MTILYQFRISHYCEKARWALDYKKLPYTTRNLLVGLHIKQIRKIAPESSVPVLKIKDRYIQGSDKILDYLDSIGDIIMTPPEADLARQAREWETSADRYFGVPIRCLLYNEILDKPHVLLPMWLDQGPFYGKLYYRFAYKQINKVVREKMQVNDRTATMSRKQIDRGIEKLHTALSRTDYLAAPYFTRADMSVCSLLAPILCPPQSGYHWHADMSVELSDYRQSLLATPAGKWVTAMYQKHR